MKKLLKTILALVFAACCFVFASKCVNTGGMAGAIADLPQWSPPQGVHLSVYRALEGRYGC